MGNAETLINGHLHPVRSEAVAFRVIEGEAVLLALEGGVYYTLNEIGTVAWDMCDGTNSVGAIVRAVIAEYEVDELTAQRDLKELLEDLTAEGLVNLNEVLGEAEKD
ncbi:PqqD family protein [Thermodesulfobacteriota bacterium]